MGAALANDEAFDNYARRYGWEYDNGGWYACETWDWYSGPVTGLILARRPPKAVAVVRFDGLTPSEVWSGEIVTTCDFDRVMTIAGLTPSAE